jgi:hypothetical protein
MKRLVLSVGIACLCAAGGRADEKSKVAIVPGSPAKMRGLLAYWSLDEGKGTTAQDASPNKMEATLKGGRWVPGVKGTALKFSKEGEYLDYGDSAKLNFKAGEAFTFAGWVKTEAQQGTVVSQRNSKDGGANIDINIAGGKLLGLVRSDKKELGQHAIVGSKGEINDGEWHHFALTRDTRRTIELFIDGVFQGKGMGADAGGSITTNLRALGYERYWAKDGTEPAKRILDGAVDEFCIFNRALTAEEIRTLAGPKRTPVVKVGPPAGAARYNANGITFDHPKGWKIMTEKIFVTSITVQNDKGTQALLQVHPPNADAKKALTLLETTFRKAFEGKVVKGSEKTVKRKIRGAEREGGSMDFEVAKDVAINFQFFSFSLGAKKPVVCVVFQHAGFDAEEAKKAFALIAGSLAASTAKPRK